MFAGHLDQPAAVALVDAHTLELAAFGGPFGPDGGKGGVFLLLDLFQARFALRNPLLVFGKEFAPFRRAVEWFRPITALFLNMLQPFRRDECAKPGFQLFQRQASVQGAGLYGLLTVAILDNKAVAVRLEFQAMAGKDFVGFLP